MKPDNLDVSYKYVKLASGLFTFSLLFILIAKPLLDGTIFKSLGDLLEAISKIGVRVFSSIFSLDEATIDGHTQRGSGQDR